MKYKQKHIPCLNSAWNDKTIYELRKIVLSWYKQNYAGKTVVNKCIGVPIHFTTRGGNKLSIGGGMYPLKAELIRVLPEILEQAVYNNWGDRKTKDPAHIIGYLNFKCKVQIDEKIKNLRIAVQMQKNGKIYWNHEINMVNKKNR
jgi:hypothetical protein